MKYSSRDSRGNTTSLGLAHGVSGHQQGSVLDILDCADHARAFMKDGASSFAFDFVISKFLLSQLFNPALFNVLLEFSSNIFKLRFSQQLHHFPEEKIHHLLFALSQGNSI